MNKYSIIILFKIIIVLFNYCNAAPTLQEQLDGLRSILNKCDVNHKLDHSKFDDLCNYNQLVFCNGDKVEIISLLFGGECTIDDISIFYNLDTFKSDSGIKITDKFFTSISNIGSLETLEIDNIVSFPSSNDFQLSSGLKYVTITTNSLSTIPSALFESGIEFLNITSSQYIQPVLTKTNSIMRDLRLTFNSKAILKNGFTQYLTSLTDISLKSIGSTSTIIPTSFLKNLKSLSFLRLYGNIAFDNGLQLLGEVDSIVMNDVVLGKCSVSPCHKFSFSTDFTITNSDIDFNDFDFTNVQYLRIYLNDYNTLSKVYKLPSINNPSGLKLTINNQNNYIIGDIPDNYCNLASVNLQNNGLNGSVPSCFKCSSSAKQMILPNQFKDFDESSPIECPNFTIDNQDQTYIATSLYNGDRYITVTGKDLGWQYIINGNTYSASIPNKEVQIQVPNEGQDGDTIQVEFQDNNIVTFKYDYAPPVINSYYADYATFKFNGNNFDLSNTNIVTMGEVQLPFSGTYDQNEASQFIIVQDEGFDIFTDFLQQGSKYQVSVKTSMGRVSNTFEFYFIQVVDLDQGIIANRLSLSGGQIQLKSKMSHIPTDYSIVKCKVNVPTTTSSMTPQDCKVNNITQDSITITYPKATIDAYTIITLDIGGRVFNLDALYGAPDITPSSSDDSTVSISTSNLNNISFIILISLLIITIISTSSTSINII